MKTYKLNNIEISEESAREFIENNPELLEKKVSGIYFFPKEGEEYWYITDSGDAYQTTNNDDYVVDIHNISTGNCYRTKEEAELARDKHQAIVRCWKWAQENASFDPNWMDETQKKYYVGLKYDDNLLFVDYNHLWQSQFTLPYFKSEEDCSKFREANKKDLLLLFTK